MGGGSVRQLDGRKVVGSDGGAVVLWCCGAVVLCVQGFISRCCFVSQAQAEGAIEGDWKDYIMASEFSTDFKFSRFDAKAAKPRDVSKLTGVTHHSVYPTLHPTDLVHLRCRSPSMSE